MVVVSVGVRGMSKMVWRTYPGMVDQIWPVPELQGHHWQTPPWCEQVPLLWALNDQVLSQH